MKKIILLPLVLLLLTVQFFIASSSLNHKKFTFDEERHFTYGQRVLHGNPYRHSPWENSIMPVSVLNGLVSSEKTDLYPRMYAGRYVTIFFLLILSCVIFFWTQELYGVIPGLFSLCLTCLDPNLIAYGQLDTLDLYATLALILPLYLYWRFLKYGGFLRGLISAIALGASQLTKYTSIYLYLFFLVITFVVFLPAIFQYLKMGRYLFLRKMGTYFIKYFILFFLISVVIINVGFCWCKPLVPLKDYAFQSHTFQALQAIPIINAIPIPFPYPFLQGVDLCQYVNDTGAAVHNTYFLGKVHEIGQGPFGFKGYFLTVSLFKVPIPSLILIFIAAWVYWKRRYEYSFWQNEFVILLPVFFFLIYTNLLVNVTIGIRYILLIFPLLYVFSGSLFIDWKKYSRSVKGGIFALVAWLFISLLSYFPHYISYVNEFIWDRKMAYRIFGDSNLDWGGNEWFLQEYLKKHPESIVEPRQPVAGHIIVAVDSLVGVWEANRYLWLRENFEPVDQIAYMYLIFDITPQQLSSIVRNANPM